MFHILDFIDSKDIRQYNKDTKFTPLEQAALIYYSRGTTVEEKLSAWREVLDFYSEEDFEQTRFGKRKFDDKKSNRQILADTIVMYENALAQRNCTEGVIFEATFYESHFPDSLYPYYYPTYDAAFTHLKESKREYIKDYDLQDVQTQATIRIKEFNTDSSSDTVFYFDHDLRMTDLYPGDKAWIFDWCSVGDIFVSIPLPFQKGDILRSITPGEVEYGILAYTPDESISNFAIKSGDSTDMTIRLDFFDTDGEFGSFGYNHAFPLDYEKCPDDELPEKFSILYSLRDTYTGKMRFGDFLNLYTYYGKDMYWKVFEKRKPNQDEE